MFRKYFEKEEEEEKNEQIEDEDINESHENPDPTSVRRKYAKTSEKNINYAGIMKQVHDEDKKWLAEHGENGDEVVTITKETIIEKGGDKDASNIEETKIVKKSSGNLDDKDATSSEIVSKIKQKMEEKKKDPFALSKKVMVTTEVVLDKDNDLPKSDSKEIKNDTIDSQEQKNKKVARFTKKTVTTTTTTKTFNKKDDSDNITNTKDESPSSPKGLSKEEVTTTTTNEISRPDQGTKKI